jgi:hypothetical protein
VKTCPEDAITLLPRLRVGSRAGESEIVARTEPFHCIRCGKPFGTARMIEAMLGKLAGHSMFAGKAERLKMCADCRVIDAVAGDGQAVITDLDKDKPS